MNSLDPANQHSILRRQRQRRRHTHPASLHAFTLFLIHTKAKVKTEYSLCNQMKNKIIVIKNWYLLHTSVYMLVRSDTILIQSKLNFIKSQKCDEIETNGSFHVTYFHWIEMLQELEVGWNGAKWERKRNVNFLISLLFTPYFVTFQTPFLFGNDKIRAVRRHYFSSLRRLALYLSSHSNHFYDLSCQMVR